MEYQNYPINQNYPISQEHPIHERVISRITKPIALQIYHKLMNKKQELEKSPHSKAKLCLLSENRGGDQVDQVNQREEETNYTVRIKRDSKLLDQVEQALERMKNGLYGICDQTEETINIKRLLSLPWTTLSLEGAEILEESHQQVRIYR